MLATLRKQRGSELLYEKQKTEPARPRRMEKSKKVEVDTPSAEHSRSREEKLSKKTEPSLSFEEKAVGGVEVIRTVLKVKHEIPPLVVLDLDQTLVSTVRTESLKFVRTGRRADVTNRKFHLWKRPYLTEFLRRVFAHVAGGRLQVAFWTAAPDAYLKEVLRIILTPEQRELLLCAWHRDFTSSSYSNCLKRVKDLRLLKKSFGVPLDRTLLVDDSSVSAEMQPTRLLKISGYYFAAKDRGLELTADFLDAAVKSWPEGNAAAAYKEFSKAWPSSRKVESLRKKSSVDSEEDSMPDLR